MSTKAKNVAKSVCKYINKYINKYWKYRTLVWMIIPGIVFLLIFRYIPMYGIIIAFKDFNARLGIIGSPWIGLYQFRRLFSSPYFFQVLRNTVVISMLKILFGFPAPIILALALNEIRNKTFKKITQTISYLPYFLSWVVISALMVDLFSPTRGVINYILGMVGFESISFLTNEGWFLVILVASNIWWTVGWGSIIYLAGLTNIDPQQYEAAIVDGAGRWKQTIHVTLPGILPVMSIMLILSMGDLLNAGFDQIFNLYNPMVMDISDIIDTYVYRKGLIDFEYSFSTAANLFKNVISFALVLCTNAIVSKYNDYSIWLKG